VLCEASRDISCDAGIQRTIFALQYVYKIHSLLTAIMHLHTV
jgi:hypothetical protein